HKAVAFDVYRAAGGGYLRRVVMMLLTSIAFFLIHPLVHVRLMARRGILHKPWRWARGWTRLWIWPAYFVRLMPAYLSYYRPGFHPGDRDAHALVEHWREQLFGPAGSLRAQTTIAA